MRKFKPQDKIKTIRDGKLDTGFIVKVFDEPQVAIVTFENGEVAKVPFSQLIIDREDADADTTTKHPGFCKRIVREDFENQLTLLTAMENFDILAEGKILLVTVSKILSRKLIDKVFGDKSSIVVDRKILIGAIADVTNPRDVIGKSDSDEFRTMTVSLCLAVATVFFGLLDHYFGNESEND